MSGFTKAGIYDVSLQADGGAAWNLIGLSFAYGVFHSLGSWMSVIYHSDMLPIEPGWEKFDALKYSIEEAKRRGIKSFAYIAALYGTNSRASKEANSVLKPKQWIKLIDRLGEIDNPTVRAKPSDVALDVKPARASRTRDGG